MGEWPYCPHDKVVSGEERYFGFDPYVDTNIAPQHVEVTSPRHREQLMKERGLVVRDREHINDLNHRRWTKGLPPLER